MKKIITFGVLIILIVAFVISFNIDNIVNYITKTDDTIDNYRVMYLVIEGNEINIYNYKYTDNFYNLSFEYRHFLNEKEKLRNYLVYFCLFLFFVSYFIILLKVFI